MKKSRLLLCALSLCASASAFAAQAVFNDSFANGVKAWQLESGQVIAGRENGGTLVLRTLNQPDGSKRSGAVTLEVSGLKPHAAYELTLRFRFEKDFADAWPWARVEIWEAGSMPAEGNTSYRIAEQTIAPQKRSRAEVADSQWRTVTLAFTPGDASSVILRLLNHPGMMDQTHWDEISITPLQQ